MGSRPLCRRRVAWVVALAMAGSLVQQRAYGQDEPVSRLTSTFLQLWADHANWPQERWQEVFRHFSAMGLRDVYVQWTLYDDISYAVPNSPGKQPPVDTILRLAETNGMRVHLGLAFHSKFFENAKPGPRLGEYMRSQQARSLAAAQEIASRYGSHRAFVGWYIAEELDDLMWPAGEARNVLFDFVAATVDGLNRIAPGKPVTISGYAGARSDPYQLGQFWSALLERVPKLTTVMFQDGIGVGNLPLTYLPQYLEVMRQATARHERELRVIVEVFRQVDGVFNGRAFRAVPVPFTFVLPQMETAAPYSKGGLVAFSIPEYMTPLGAPGARESYLAYLDWLRASGAQTSLASRLNDTRAR